MQRKNFSVLQDTSLQQNKNATTIVINLDVSRLMRRNTVPTCPKEEPHRHQRVLRPGNNINTPVVIREVLMLRVQDENTREVGT